MSDQWQSSKHKVITTNVLREMKLNKEKIAMLTAYDFSLANILDNAGIDVILVGDSASNVMADTRKLLTNLERLHYR